ncbi:PREDICTED: A-kinase anchor protein 10, mitochondrial isoform X2 [Dinoponera quadriceps]|uniref:A-kinase anchor protein 10, mitochondrial isoform X2 n=1 Tax=Dinoponera quadriceps TaxID=609295 RepID=A0A6P3XDG9_DINQU|nr:PREDICTED: A-kinase anchor protein 10, mitochondrial isoform X2 [Dinoponera quadriceps]
MGQRDKSGLLESSPTKSTSSGSWASDAFNGGASIQTSPGVLCSLEEEAEEEIIGCDIKEEAYSFSSRLSKALPEVLTDKSALGYFIQFMDTRKRVALIKFWLEVECLCSASGMPGCAEKARCSNQKELIDALPNSLDNNNEGNLSCNVFSNDVDTQTSSEVPCDEDASSDNTTSVLSGMPKTSQVVSETRQSNHDCGNKRHDMTTGKQDALRIYRKYIVKEALGANQISEELRLNMEKAVAQENIEPILRCLSAIQSIVYDILENEYINDFLRSEFHCKHQIDVLTSGNVQLADILYNETAFFYFMEFMELENKRELLDFWMSVISYKQNLLDKKGAADPEEAQSDAVVIYEKYFSLQATMPLGFSDKIRFHVEQNICREDEGGPQPDCFDKPNKIVYNFLNKYYLPAFLSSQLYYKYLSELISTIQSSPCPSLHAKIRRTGSDCSSEVSSVCTSMPSTSQITNYGNRLPDNKRNINNHMNIDTRQLYDPDSLWKRNKYRLSIGYIDNLGRFITEIEPDPHRKYESRLTRAVKRLVNIEQDKAKEELAWRIAEMIIREITSMTLGATNLPS